MASLKLYMLLIGCKPPGRHTEQHDIFFGVGEELRDLVPGIKTFWPQPGKIHLDAWREVSQVDGFDISIVVKDPAGTDYNQAPRLFFRAVARMF